MPAGEQGFGVYQRLGQNNRHVGREIALDRCVDDKYSHEHQAVILSTSKQV